MFSITVAREQHFIENDPVWKQKMSSTTPDRIPQLLLKVYSLNSSGKFSNTRPDCAPSDFCFFPQLKKALGDQKFPNNQKVNVAVKNFFKKQSPEFYALGIERLVLRYCLQSERVLIFTVLPDTQIHHVPKISRNSLQ